jgi:hypothetical protein
MGLRLIQYPGHAVLQWTGYPHDRPFGIDPAQFLRVEGSRRKSFIKRNWSAIEALAVGFHRELDHRAEYDLVLDALAPFNAFIERDATLAGGSGKAFGPGSGRA